MGTVLTIIIGFFLAATANATEKNREQIGEVLGQPVYRQQVEGEGCPLDMALKRHIITPVPKKYCALHSKELEPNEQEINQYIAYWDKEYQPPPDRNLAISAIKPWKLKCHIYRKYGGGRFIIGQMGGFAPFDAKYNWLKEQEKNGLFKITAPEMREAFYGYWTSTDHGQIS